MRPFGVAGLQLELPMRDNSDVIAAEIASAKRIYPWLDMIVLGELCWFGPDIAAAQPLPGPLEERMCEIARAANVWLVAGSLYERDGDRIYNTAPIINPAGEVVARCRKLYPFTPYEKGVASGDGVTVFEIPGVGRIGVSIQDLTPDLAQAMNTNRTSGAVIARVEPGSAAEHAGLKSGDLIVSANGVAMRDGTQLRNTIGLSRIGDEVKLVVDRGGSERAVAVKVEAAVLSSGKKAQER